MRDTNSDMMEDDMSVESMMDCGVDTDGMDTIGDLTSDRADSTSTIRDAAERLLTLLGVNDLDDDFLSSSEDEGVEVDLDENDDDDDDDDDDDEYDDDDDDDDDDDSNTRLLHQFAVTLAEELKYAQLQSNNNIIGKINSQCNRIDGNNENIQRMDVTYSDDGHQTFREQSSMLGNKFDINFYNNYDKFNCNDDINCRILNSKTIQSRNCDEFFLLKKRCKLDECNRITNEENAKTDKNCEISSLWAAGWDSCADEAVKYLIDVEGLHPTHPTVLSLKSHLDMQRNRAFIQHKT